MQDPTSTVLVLRTVNADGTSYNGFQWPLEVGAVVECPDWDPEPKCGNGLHGLVRGEGDWDLLSWSPDAKALVLEVEESCIVEIGGKVKFPRAVVREITSLTSAICRLACDGARIAKTVANMITEGGKTASNGNASRLAASGDASQLATSGSCSQLAASGYASRLAASGYNSRLAASGDASQLATSGSCSQLAASGDGSVIAAAADNCIAKTGPGGAIALTWHDGKRYRITVGYVGEGLDADTWYRLDEVGRFEIVS